MTKPAALSPLDGFRYGWMGFPLAFVALPLYVVLPNHYAKAFGVPLAALGGVLLLARLLDALMDPLLGRWSDQLFQRSPKTVLHRAAIACVLLGGGFYLLFFPMVSGPHALLWWAAAALMVTYLAYSFLSISHQSWGAMLGGDETYRSRVVAWREGLGLAGVVTASISPVALGLPATTALFFIAIVVGWSYWTRAPRPPVTSAAAHSGSPAAQHSVWRPLARRDFRALLAVFVVNGIASAIPATLILFFVQDRLQAPPAHEPLFLGSYFVCAALAIPLWLKLVARIGLVRTWLCGMGLSIAVFVFASGLGAGDTVPFVVVCALSGVALGTDLTIPGALLAGLIARQGDQGQAEGAYFGWWNFVTKLNLALAAGVALPALAWWGYSPGARDAAALETLTFAYCLLPCALKAAAAALLYTLFLRRSP
ncbi:MFS transporter [Rhodoferax sp.]|uniref:MFS transporter n=1 Tax=Rhodoferax sp. TaxID=50421 RepID=UPI0025F57336|nr:MFS transporter [Rhodoferax sp.]